MPYGINGREENESIITIRVRTHFKPQIEDNIDFRSETIKLFHNTVENWIEEQLMENEDFEQGIMEEMWDSGELPSKVKEFSELGSISIGVETALSVEVVQKDLDEDEIEELRKKNKTLALPANQMTLS